MRPPLLAANCIVLLLLLPAALAHAWHGLDASGVNRFWEQYKSTFIQHDGRVIDRQQSGLSHSEGQGYGLLLAVLNNDKATFDTILRWTGNNLQGRKDNLLPWAWGKRHNGQWGIIDYNNATDGDILVAFALTRAAMQWNVPEYRKQGLKLIEALRSNLSTTYQGHSYLLPSYYGFQKDGELVLNPSYQIFAAFRLFARVDDKEFWDSICRDSLLLVNRATFGTMKLPADWIALKANGIGPWEERPPLFGYEAIRVLLYLSWERKPVFPEGLKALLAEYQEKGTLPATIDLSGNGASSGEAPAGFYAVCARAAGKSGHAGLAGQLWAKALEKAAIEKEQYYSMSLLLLALHDVEP